MRLTFAWSAHAAVPVRLDGNAGHSQEPLLTDAAIARWVPLPALSREARRVPGYRRYLEGGSPGLSSSVGQTQLADNGLEERRLFFLE